MICLPEATSNLIYPHYADSEIDPSVLYVLGAGVIFGSDRMRMMHLLLRPTLLGKRKGQVVATVSILAFVASPNRGHFRPQDADVFSKISPPATNRITVQAQTISLHPKFNSNEQYIGIGKDSRVLPAAEKTALQ